MLLLGCLIGASLVFFVIKVTGDDPKSVVKVYTDEYAADFFPTENDVPSLCVFARVVPASLQMTNDGALTQSGWTKYNTMTVKLTDFNSPGIDWPDEIKKATELEKFQMHARMLVGELVYKFSKQKLGITYTDCMSYRDKNILTGLAPEKDPHAPDHQAALARYYVMLSMKQICDGIPLPEIDAPTGGGIVTQIH